MENKGIFANLVSDRGLFSIYAKHLRLYSKTTTKGKPKQKKIITQFKT